MQPQPERWMKIEVNVEASNERLLAGLDVWLHLELISDQEVKRICRQHLSCMLPVAREARQVTQAALIQPSRLPQVIPATVARTAQVLQSLMAEFSLMWLLFLGVFMVVVSSGVLAASQWRQFTPQGQYLILLGYTLAFWVASVRIGQHENLRLTARMLKIATLLIIPVNFWMIDGLKLWRSGVGLAIALFAAVVLTALTIRLLKSTTNTQHQQLILINSVGLSWLHWGWGWTGFPIVATYIGTVGTVFSLFYQYQGNDPLKPSKQQLSLGTITVTAATLLLLTRAIFVVKIPISQLGLAIAICGWLCCWLSQRNYTQENQEISNSPLTIAGVVLLLVGWLVCVTTIPLQAIAISGLGLWLLFTRLHHRWQVQDLTAIFLVGLQLFWLLWRLIPLESRQNLLAFGVEIAGTAFMPQALLSVALFPYVLLTLFFATRLRRWQQPILANQAKVLALLLGVVLTSLSLLNPLVRLLNLLLSSLTLAFITQGATAKTKLIYGTHITSLAAIASGINLFFPDLGIRAWTGILLGIMVAEWSFSVGSTWRSWRRSAWFIGLGLAAISYVLLLRYAFLKDATGWSLIGLLIPVTLTTIASKPQFFQRRLASWLSVGGLCLIQLLTFTSAIPLLTSLGIATIVMLLNTQHLQQLLTAAIAVGFGLAFSIVAIWQIHPQISLEVFINIVAIAPLALWLLPLVSKRRTTLARIYIQATDGWAITIAILYLIIMSLYELFIYNNPTVVSGELLLADLVLTIAIVYRTFLKPSNLSFYGIAWSLKVLVVGVATQSTNPLVNLAITNLALGLTIQITGDWWIRISGHNYRSSWHVIPLIYAIFGCWLQHLSFTASSGLFTLGAALIGIGVGRRNQNYKFLTYLSLVGGSIATYELVIYQLLQVPDSSFADELVVLAGLGTVIAICNYLFARWLVPYLRVTRNELYIIADLHWAISSGFVGLALLTSSTFSAVLVTTILAIYALIQGRSSENWTYAGIVEAVAAFSFLLDLAYPDSQWLVAWSGAIASIFAFAIYTLPWNNWGWSLRPWQRAAYVLPGLFICLSIGKIAIQSLLIAAAVYAWFAKGSGKVRLSYVSIVLADWAIARLFRIYGLDEPLWYATLLGGSLLYMTQVDPALQASTEKEKRHLLRCLATGLICLTALYQAEANLLLGLLTIGFSTGFILTGLALRIRAFLYIGTVSFIVQIGRQIWFFIHDYSLTLWAVGIVLGITFIWIAANFESRREQMTSMLQGWVTELEDWD